LVYNNILNIIRKAPTLIGAANVGKYLLTPSRENKIFYSSKRSIPSKRGI